MRIEFNGCMVDQQKHLLDLINKLMLIVPDWVVLLKVNGPRVATADDGHIASIQVDPHYREATLFLSAYFFARHDQLLVLLHEFCHLHTSPCAEEARLHLNEAAEKSMSRWLEFSTVSLADTFQKLLNIDNPDVKRKMLRVIKLRHLSTCVNYLKR